MVVIIALTVGSIEGFKMSCMSASSGRAGFNVGGKLGCKRGVAVLVEG